MKNTFFDSRPGLAALVLGIILVQTGSRSLAQGADKKADPFKNYAVQEVTDLRYRSDKDADPVRHRLDIYLPKGKKDYPVIIFVHGGAWMLGDKNFFGWGPDIGHHFAANGIGAVMPSYRLSPKVKHPEHIKDVARAVAWTYQNIEKYGGRKEQMFLCGHSAGGHLVSLLATDDTYLKAEKLSPAIIKGVISVSGVYRVQELDISLPLATKAAKPAPPAKVGFRLNLFWLIFGNDSKVLKDASPVNHVKPGLPAFLLINAAKDLPLLPAMAMEFAKSLKKFKDKVQSLNVADRDHESVMFRATSDDDPVAQAIAKFVVTQTKKK